MSEFYTITPDAFIYEGSETTAYEAENWSPLPNPSGSSQIQTIVSISQTINVHQKANYKQLDSGTTLIYLPTNISNAVNTLFSPPGVWNDDIVAYSVDCNAVAPAFAVKIGGVIFSVDKRDMIMDDGTGQGTCQGGVSDGGTYAPYVLGDVFMKNVMVVFDVGASELRFRSRLVDSTDCKFLRLANSLKGILLNENWLGVFFFLGSKPDWFFGNYLRMVLCNRSRSFRGSKEIARIGDFV